MYEKTIVPTIFAKDRQTFSHKLDILKFSPVIHLDFMDGIFTKNGKSVSFDVMRELIPSNDSRKFHVHLMAHNPEKYIKNLLKIKNVCRVLLQYESFEDKTHIHMSINEFRSRNYEVFLVLNPDTSSDVIEPFASEIDGVMIMSVVPGAENQAFIEEVLDKVKNIKSQYPNLEICMDGGLNSDTIANAFLAGVDTFCVGSYISSSDAPKEHWENLKVLVNG